MPSLLRILKYGHPLLRERAHDLKTLGSRERGIIDSMLATMYHNRGIGLAATQVGWMERVFVLDADQDRDAEDEGAPPARHPRVFINPEIIWESEDDEPYTEGCLSMPGIDADVYRPSAVRVRARDEHFEPFEIEADGLLARVIQHEYDHLSGTLFVDRLTLLKRARLAAGLNRLKSATEAELPPPDTEYPIVLLERE